MTQALKRALRKDVANKLKAIHSDLKQRQSDMIAKKLTTSDVFRSSSRISIYLSTDDEVDTTPILEEAFRLEKKVFVPTYEGDRMEMLQLKGLPDLEQLPLTKWNIRQPNIDDASRENLLASGVDLFIVPGVAFTVKGARLGHGKGFYDKYLRSYFEKFPGKRGAGLSPLQKVSEGKTTLVALAFHEQICEALPLEAHDYLLDEVLTA